MADGNFLEKAIQFVKQARDEDEKEHYSEAYRLYLVALEWFMAAMKCTYLSLLSSLPPEWNHRVPIYGTADASFKPEFSFCNFLLRM